MHRKMSHMEEVHKDEIVELEGRYRNHVEKEIKRWQHKYESLGESYTKVNRQDLKFATL